MKKILLFVGFALSLTMNAQVPSYVPTNGLVAYYPFNGNANDVSSNAINGTLSGATLSTDRFGNANSAFSFYGINDYIEVQTNSGKFDNQEYTISFWIKTNQSASGVIGGSNVNPAIISRLITGGPSNNNPNVNSATDIKVIYEIGGSANSNTSIGGILNTVNQNGATGPNKILGNVWHHVVYSYSSGNHSELVYCDGININQIQNTGPLQSIPYNPYPIRFGRSLQTYWKDFSGELDDIGFWNRALTPSEIISLYQSELSCQSLVINSGTLSSFNPPVYQSTVTIYPNPANDQITIDCGSLANVVGYHIEIVNTLGQVVFNQPMNTQQYTIALNTWTGTGMYFVKIYDASNNLLNTKKIILQ